MNPLDYHNNDDNKLLLDHKLQLPYLNSLLLYLNPLDYHHKHSLPNPNPELLCKNQLDYHNGDDNKFRLLYVSQEARHNGDTQGYLTRGHAARRGQSRYSQAFCRHKNYLDDTHRLLYLNQLDLHEDNTHKLLQAHLNQNLLNYHTKASSKPTRKGTSYRRRTRRRTTTGAPGLDDPADTDPLGRHAGGRNGPLGTPTA